MKTKQKICGSTFKDDRGQTHTCALDERHADDMCCNGAQPTVWWPRPKWVGEFLRHPDSVDSVFDKRDLLERWPLDEIVEYAMHLPPEDMAQLPDKTLDQLMLKCAFARVQPEVRWRDGWLVVETPWGTHCFILNADGKALSSFQVL